MADIFGELLCSTAMISFIKPKQRNEWQQNKMGTGWRSEISVWFMRCAVQNGTERERCPWGDLPGAREKVLPQWISLATEVNYEGRERSAEVGSACRR